MHVEKKTDRIYGEVRDTIMRLAARPSGVTVDEVMRELRQHRKLATANLRCALLHGHIIVARPATIGCKADRAIYTLAPSRRRTPTLDGAGETTTTNTKQT